MNYDHELQRLITAIKADKSIVQPWRNMALSAILDAELDLVTSNLEKGMFVEQSRSEVLKIAQRRVYTYPDGTCTYCGFAADTQDHLIPRTFSGDVARELVPTVPSCRECNSLLTDTFCVDVRERREIAHERIARRYRKALEAPDFTREELADMGNSLRSYIESSMETKKLVMTRLKWPLRDDYDFRHMEIV